MPGEEKKLSKIREHTNIELSTVAPVRPLATDGHRRAQIAPKQVPPGWESVFHLWESVAI